MKELREEKKKLEEQILKLINEYEDKFECYVYDINLLHNGGRNKDGKLEAILEYSKYGNHISKAPNNEQLMFKINEIIDYLKSKGE